MTKPFAESCEQNKHVILDVLKEEFSNHRRVLEIGSGTGQHAAFFSQALPHLIWQCSDRFSELTGISAWLAEANSTNLLDPIELDVQSGRWPTTKYDAVFSANAVHIMSWEAVKSMFEGLNDCLTEQAVFCLYGPFNYQGKFTSESNARFDQWLKQRDPLSGIRDIDDINNLAEECGLVLTNDYEMPANNRILCWRK